jgi:hypothetical protein
MPNSGLHTLIIDKRGKPKIEVSIDKIPDGTYFLGIVFGKGSIELYGKIYTEIDRKPVNFSVYNPYYTYSGEVPIRDYQPVKLEVHIVRNIEEKI